MMLKDVEMDIVEDEPTLDVGGGNAQPTNTDPCAALEAAMSTISESQLRAVISRLVDNDSAAFHAFLNLLVEQKKRKADDAGYEDQEQVCINCDLPRNEWTGCCPVHRGTSQILEMVECKFA